jgi:hypothetical protein
LWTGYRTFTGIPLPPGLSQPPSERQPTGNRGVGTDLGDVKGAVETIRKITGPTRVSMLKEACADLGIRLD